MKGLINSPLSTEAKRSVALLSEANCYPRHLYPERSDRRSREVSFIAAAVVEEEKEEAGGGCTAV